MQSREQVIKKMHELQMVQRGKFTLKSGAQSEFYLDLRRMLADPSLLREIARALSEHPHSKRGSIVAGVPFAALALATVVAQVGNRPSVLVRKEKKAHGTGKLIEGVYQTGDRVVLIEDVITSGDSLVEVVNLIRSEGLDVAAVLAVVDRGQGGLNRIRDLGIPADALFTVDELLEFKPQSVLVRNTAPQNATGSIDRKTSICAALDTATFGEALEATRLLWERQKISATKLHADLFPDFDLRRARDLREYCDERGITILEDRKLADIGSVMIRQLHDGPQKISSWAHAVTVHAGPGLASLSALAESCVATQTRLILITDLSPSDHLFNESYQKAALAIAGQLADGVSGIVSQKHRPPRVNQKLWMPGLSLDSARSGDGKGQTYRTLEQIPAEIRPDYAIMGRSLLETLNTNRS